MSRHRKHGIMLALVATLAIGLAPPAKATFGSNYTNSDLGLLIDDGTTVNIGAGAINLGTLLAQDISVACNSPNGISHITLIAGAAPQIGTTCVVDIGRQWGATSLDFAAYFEGGSGVDEPLASEVSIATTYSGTTATHQNFAGTRILQYGTTLGTLTS